MPSNAPPLALSIDPTALRPLIQAVVEQTISAMGSLGSNLPEGRICYSEAEAAALLGVRSNVLRDERGRGRIGFSKIACGRIRFSHADLLAYLAAGRANE